MADLLKVKIGAKACALAHVDRGEAVALSIRRQCAGFEIKRVHSLERVPWGDYRRGVVEGKWSNDVWVNGWVR